MGAQSRGPWFLKVFLWLHLFKYLTFFSHQEVILISVFKQESNVRLYLLPPIPVVVLSIVLNITYFIIIFNSFLSPPSYTSTKSPSSIKPTSKYSLNIFTFHSHLQYFNHLTWITPTVFQRVSGIYFKKGKPIKPFACLKFFSSFPLLLDKIQNLKYITESCVIWLLLTSIDSFPATFSFSVFQPQGTYFFFTMIQYCNF